ncbi:hypothetical protein Tco_0733563, partial [Tanacetum coccineum]
WHWSWSRQVLGARTPDYPRDMLNKISQVIPNDVEDSCVWSIASDRAISIGVTRRHIDDILLASLPYSTNWDNTLPRKVNAFLWRLNLDRLPHRVNLSSQGIDISSISCPT